MNNTNKTEHPASQVPLSFEDLSKPNRWGVLNGDTRPSGLIGRMARSRRDSNAPCAVALIGCVAYANPGGWGLLFCVFAAFHIIKSNTTLLYTLCFAGPAPGQPPNPSWVGATSNRQDRRRCVSLLMN